VDPTTTDEDIGRDGRSARVADLDDHRTDSELIASVRRGVTSAFGELYRRHYPAVLKQARQLCNCDEPDDLAADTFTKVFADLLAGKGPVTGYAMRAYLLTAVRHLAYDRQRRKKKIYFVPDISDVQAAETRVEFIDTAIAEFNCDLVAAAFSSLENERWRTVLWLTEVENMKPADIAPLLGLTANGVSALKCRARSAFQTAFLQAHLTRSCDQSCRRATDQFAGYLRGTLCARDRAAVERHLSACVSCADLLPQLAELNEDIPA
jgi:RNA polymerase sigma factor (sigma-70 family)